MEDSQYINPPNKKHKYVCKNCLFYSNKQSNLDRHKKTAKHLYNIENNIICLLDTINSCKCGKKYKHPTNLTRHKLSCKYIEEDNLNDGCNIITSLIQQNNILSQQTSKMQSKIDNIITNSNPLILNTSLYNNVNTSKLRFNIEVFLNNTCNESINMTDFINGIEITQEYIDFSLAKGFVDGLCNIFSKEIKKIPNNIRPLHCTDVKRSIIYIKNNGCWEKDLNNNILINNLNELSNKQYMYLKNVWFFKNKMIIIGGDNQLQHKHCCYLVAIGHSATNDKYKQPIINTIKKMVYIDKCT
jgi:hypothetical protein